MNSFITGSHVYGTPREDSDLDLVCLLATPQERALLQQHSEGEGNVLRFGRLNIIAPETEGEFAVWRFATEALQLKGGATGEPITREEAVRTIAKLRARLGLTNTEPSR